MSSNDFNIQMDEMCAIESNCEPKAAIGLTSGTMPQVGSIVCRICYSSDHIDR